MNGISELKMLFRIIRVWLLYRKPKIKSSIFHEKSTPNFEVLF